MYGSLYGFMLYSMVFGLDFVHSHHHCSIISFSFTRDSGVFTITKDKMSSPLKRYTIWIMENWVAPRQRLKPIPGYQNITHFDRNIKHTHTCHSRMKWKTPDTCIRFAIKRSKWPFSVCLYTWMGTYEEGEEEKKWNKMKLSEIRSHTYKTPHHIEVRGPFSQKDQNNIGEWRSRLFWKWIKWLYGCGHLSTN